MHFRIFSMYTLFVYENTYNLHKPNSDCPVFIFRHEPVFSLFHMLLYVGLCAVSNRIHPTFSYIMSFSCIRYMFTLTTPLVRNGYLAQSKVLPKMKNKTVRIRFVQVGCIFIYKQRVHRNNYKMHRDVFFFTRLKELLVMKYSRQRIRSNDTKTIQNHSI